MVSKLYFHDVTGLALRCRLWVTKLCFLCFVFAYPKIRSPVLGFVGEATLFLFSVGWFSVVLVYSVVTEPRL